MKLMLELKKIFDNFYIRNNRKSVERTREYYKFAIKSLEDKSTIDEVAEAYTWLCNISFELGDLEGVLEAVNTGIKLNSSPIFKSALYNNGSAVYLELGDSDSAKEYMKKAFDFALQSKNKILIESCSSNLEIILSGKEVSGTQDYYLNDQDKTFKG